MNENTLKNLNNLTRMLGADRLLTPEDVTAIKEAIIGILANNKREIEGLTGEAREVINGVLNKIEDEHDAYLKKTEKMAQEVKSDTTEAVKKAMEEMETVKRLCKEVMESKPLDGKDADEEKIVADVLAQIKLPEYKEVMLDDGGQIVDKINALPVNEENQIDASHIKNLPKVKSVGGGITQARVLQLIQENGGSGSPGGSNTQLQYNNNNVFGGISGATTNGTAVTYSAGNLIAADVTASGSGGLLLQANNGTDIALLGAGASSGATFYGGVNLSTMTQGSVLFAGASGAITQDNTNFFWNDTSNFLKIGGSFANEAGALRVNGNVFASGTFSIPGLAELSISSLYAAGTFAIRGFNGTARTDVLQLTNQASTNLAANFNTWVGINSSLPTHSLTLGSTSTGIALYNTADQTTNYERLHARWASNVFVISTQQAGTGTTRNLQITTPNGSGITFVDSDNSTGSYQFTKSVGLVGATVMALTGSATASSGTTTFLAVRNTLSQSDTAGYTALLVNPTETTIGSGTKLLADFQVGGKSKFSVTNAAVTTISNTSGQTFTFSPVLGGANYPGVELLTTAGNGSFFRANTTSGVQLDMLSNAAVSGIIRTNNSYPLELRTNNTVGLTISTAQVGTFANNSIITANAITATGNAATIPITKGRNIVTNNSAATLTITLTTGAVNMQTVIVQILDFSAVAQTITWVNTENSTVTAPTTSNGSTTLPLTVGFIYNSATSKWRCIASA